MEEGFEKTRHFLQLLTDRGHLTGEDAHLQRVREKRYHFTVTLTYSGFYMSRLYRIDGMVIVHARHVN